MCVTKDFSYKTCRDVCSVDLAFTSPPSFSGGRALTPPKLRNIEGRCPGYLTSQ